MFRVCCPPEARPPQSNGETSKQANLPPDKWLTQEGFHRSQARIAELEASLQQYNIGGHELVWNKKIGKIAGREDEGRITCARCRREWFWRHRNSNLKISKCRPAPPPPSQNSILCKEEQPQRNPLIIPAVPTWRSHRTSHASSSSGHQLLQSYNFWDPLGPPAPTTSTSASIPEVKTWSEVSQCSTHFSQSVCSDNSVCLGSIVRNDFRNHNEH